jgi:hypothetical protein
MSETQTPKQRVDAAFDYADENGLNIDHIKLNQEAYAEFLSELAQGLQAGTEISVNSYRHASVSVQSNAKAVEFIMSYTPPVEEENNEPSNTEENENA